MYIFYTFNYSVVIHVRHGCTVSLYTTDASHVGVESCCAKCHWPRMPSDHSYTHLKYSMGWIVGLYLFFL